MCCVLVVYVFESCGSSAALEVASCRLIVRYGVVQCREKQNWFLPYIHVDPSLVLLLLLRTCSRQILGAATLISLEGLRIW